MILLLKTMVKIHNDISGKSDEKIGFSKIADLHVFNLWVVVKEVFDLDRENVFSASDDHVFASTDDSDVAIFIHSTKITIKNPERRRMRIFNNYRKQAISHVST